MRIVLCNSSLGAGGAERSMVILAEELQARGHEITVITLSDVIPDCYTLPPTIRRIQKPLGPYASVRWFDAKGNLMRLRSLRKTLQSEKPDIILSFLDGTNELVLLSTIGWKVPRLISCQNDIRQHPCSKRWEILRKWTYRLASRVVFLDEEQAQWCEQTYPGWKTAGIPNPLPPIPEEAPAPILHPNNPHTLVAMGRLTHQKGFDLLLQSFARIESDFPEWNLLILGEGPDRAALETQAAELGLQDRVQMPGIINPPFPVLRQCDLFVFSSRYEGQGMALAEAMACGLPAVSFDCPSGPGYIIRHEVDGLLVPNGDVEAFAQAMSRLMHDNNLRTQMAKEAVKVRNRFDRGSILERWLSLFEETRSATRSAA